MARVEIPDAVAADVLFASNRTCCVCQVPGKAIQIHHIDEDNSNSHDKDNLAVLCLECHNDTQLRGGFGRKLSPELVIKHRDDWHRRVQVRRDETDRLAVEAMAAVTSRIEIEASDTLQVSAAEAVRIGDEIVPGSGGEQVRDFAESSTARVPTFSPCSAT